MIQVETKEKFEIICVLSNYANTRKFKTNISELFHFAISDKFNTSMVITRDNLKKANIFYKELKEKIAKTEDISELFNSDAYTTDGMDKLLLKLGLIKTL